MGRRLGRLGLGPAPGSGPAAALAAVAALAVAALAGMAACTRAPAAPVRLVRVWCHQGQEAENRAMRGIVAAFNAAQAPERVRAEITFFPDYQYTEKLSIAAAARLLRPLDPWIEARDRADFLPSILAQGTIGGRLYALGAFDSALVLYYDRDLLARAGVAPPAGAGAWTWDQFLAACAKLQAAGIEPVALHMDESSDEWFTYAFSPVLWSAGGELISADGTRVRGVLASPANVRSLRAWQELFLRKYAAADPVDPDPFGHGRTAMDWSGHWLARAHLADKDGRLGAMPLPRAGDRCAAACGSWCWGVSAAARDPEAAARWLKWVTDARHGIEPIVRANGAVPARRSAFAAFPEYAHPPYALFRRELETCAHPRPRTPYYAALTQGFAAALRDIAHGADVAARLRLAEDEIQAVIDRRAGTRPAPEAAP